MNPTRIPTRTPPRNRRRTRALIALALLAALAFAAAPSALAAIGCTLSNPARDLKTLFPDMTSYREDIKEMHKLPDGRDAYAALQARVGADLDPVYEAYDTPYTLYSVYTGDTPRGYVHGVNVPGRGGVIQIFLALDPGTGAIQRMFYQRLESPAGGGAAMRNPATTGQFAGLTLADFYKHDYYAIADPDSPADTVGRITPPANLHPDAMPDWRATLRGIRKNLILMDIFVYGRRNDPFYERAEEARNPQEK